jgi:predicted  nucleic acid-binding Zn-ribbon protein
LAHRYLSSDRHTSLTEQLKGIRMAIDESKRQDLYLVATEKFGRKEADTLMTLLPTSVWEDVATKTDLELHSALLKIQFNEVHNDLRTEISGVRTELKGDIADLKDSLASLRGELKGDIADLRAENASLRTELKADIASLRTELKADIASLRTELKGDIASLRTELKGDIADVRLEIAELRTEMHQMFRKNYMVMISAIFTINSLFFAATKFWG